MQSVGGTGYGVQDVICVGYKECTIGGVQRTRGTG